MKRIQKDYKYKQAFTIVELLIIVIVVGLLAAITVVGFGSWRTRVAEKEVNSDLLNLIASMEDVRNRTNAYPTYSAGTQFNGVNSTRGVFKQSTNVTITYSSGNATTYCVTAQSTVKPSVSMFVNMASSNKSPQVGSC